MNIDTCYMKYFFKDILKDIQYLCTQQKIKFFELFIVPLFLTTLVVFCAFILFVFIDIFLLSYHVIIGLSHKFIQLLSRLGILSIHSPTLLLFDINGVRTSFTRCEFFLKQQVSEKTIEV